jgi:energy-coupling factor transporter ATP-binding protein EcfA2
VTATVLRAHALGKKYKQRWALADCTLDIPAGRVVGLVGPNGAGKSTLLNLASGLLTPTTGTVEVCGGRPASGAAQLAKVGFVAFAFILGVTVGVLVRRTLPAMAITLAVFIAVQIAMPLRVRPHLATPAHVTVPITATTRLSLGNDESLSVNIGKPGAWLISEQTLDTAGRPSALPASVTDCVNSRTSPDICIGKLADLHYQQLATYQPARNFWPLQWAEAGLFLALSLALTGSCVWRIRRLS